MSGSRRTRGRTVTEAQLSIRNAKTIGREDVLHCYDGYVHFGNSSCPVYSTILAFSNESAKTLCHQLNRINSPFVMNVVTSVEATNECDTTYLAFPCFEKTYASYIEKESVVTVEKDRFAEQFIEVTGHVIEGLETLHSNGFYCPHFTGHHVAVMCEGGQVSAKIWSFCVAGSEGAKFSDWDRLANKIEQAAMNHGVYSLEINDFCEKLRRGQLTGKKALKHSAMLNVYQKFNNIIALNRYAMKFCKGKYPNRHPYVNDPVKVQVHADLLHFLQEVSHWTVDMPGWIAYINFARGRPAIDVANGATFIWELRSIIEHKKLYIPFNTAGEPSVDLESDLEWEFRKAWQEQFLKVQNFATDLQLRI